MAAWALSLAADWGESLLLPASPPLSPARHAGRIAIVSLGYRLHPHSCEPSHLLAQRLLVAADLAQKGWWYGRRTLIFSGGVGLGLNCSEATAMQVFYQKRLSTSLLRLLQRPTIELEDTSRSTRENALFTVAMLRKRHPAVRTLVVVTNRFHQKRACATFRHVARTCPIQIECASMPSSLSAPAAHRFDRIGSQPSLEQISELLWMVIREPFAILLYYVRGWISLDFNFY